MNRIAKWTASVSAFALVAVPTIAQAAPVGTAAGVDITNTVTVDFQVGGVDQTQQDATDTFRVDRKIDLVVATVDSSEIGITPGEENAITTFTVTNESNDTIDFLLAAANQSGGTGQFGGTDDFDMSNLRIYIETDGTAGLDMTSDTLASSLSQIASGDTVTVYVVANSAITDPDNGIATVILTATAADGVTAGAAISGLTGAAAGTGGSALVESAGANGKDTVETVFADAAYSPSGDTEYNGQHAARSDYEITAARLTVDKVSRVVSDPVGSADPRAIPGSVVEYCVVVSNGSGGATATSVLLSDIVPSTLTYVENSIFLNGEFDGDSTCSDTGGSAGSDAVNWDSGSFEVSNTFASVAEDVTVTLRFQATIN